MGLVNADDGLGSSHLVQAFSWDSIRVFGDIGGSLGATAITLAGHFPSLRCVIQDETAVINYASSAVPVKLAERVALMAHDFFSEQPTKGADVYRFRWIFHNWSDKYCIKILQCLIPALKSGARVIMSEFMVPPLGAISAYREWIIR